MIKKIIIAFLIAFAVISFSEIDIYDILEKFDPDSQAQAQQSCTLTLGDCRVYIGMSEADVAAAFGEPCDTLPSEYGFRWNIYHDNFKNYIQIGIKNGKTVGIYTNSANFDFCGLGYGTKKEDVSISFESPLDGIVKGSTRYLSNGTESGANLQIYKTNGSYVTFFYDTHTNNCLTSINIIECGVEESFERLYAPASDELQHSFEMQSFYVTNALRVREGLSSLIWSDELYELSLAHSQDMVANGYFSHIDTDGNSVLQRAQRSNIAFHTIGENLAMGAQSPIYMHELLMNSKGHRENILSDFTHMGTGVAFADNDSPYLTQNFLN